MNQLSNLTMIPQLGFKYFWDTDKNTLIVNDRGVFKPVDQQNGKYLIKLNLNDQVITRKMTQAEFFDLINHPTILSSDLVTTTQIRNTRIKWGWSTIKVKHLLKDLPTKHCRLDQKSKRFVFGWTAQEIREAENKLKEEIKAKEDSKIRKAFALSHLGLFL